MTMQFSADEDFAKQLDAEDPLRHFREKFHLLLGKDAVVFVSRNVARTDGAAHRRKAGRSDLHEQPDGQPAPDDGDILSADEISLQNFNGRSGVSFRHLRDQNTDRSSWT